MKDNHLHETLELNLEVMVIKNQSATMIQDIYKIELIIRAFMAL